MSKVLIVEDNKVLLNSLRVKLENSGYEVITAEDGDEAIASLKAKPDAVLLDILLPQKSGFEVLEEINKRPELKKVTVIIISNSGQNVEVDRAKRLGAKDFLVKADFTPQEVLDKLANFLPPPGADPAHSSLKESKISNYKSGTGTRGTIFVVEDDSFLRKLLVDKLKREGFEVVEATGGKEALEYLKKNLPLLILLDLVMPGIDGFEVLDKIRKDPSTKNIPVIVLSNLGEKENVERAKSLGADDYLVKAHFILDEIVAKVSQLISKRYL